MDTSYCTNVMAPHLSGTFDGSASQSKSTYSGKYLLIALGIITLIGSIVATYCLYSQLGYTSFAAGGAGLAIGIFCFLLSTFCNGIRPATQTENALTTTPSNPHVKVDRPTGDTNPLNIVPIQDRLPCRHEGASCYVNSVLQIMGHLPPFRNLFDKTQNQLEKGLDEKDDSLRKRQKVQEIGNALINCILEGRQAKNLGNFTDAVNDALEAGGHFTTDSLVPFDIQVARDPILLMTKVERILDPQGITSYGFGLSQPLSFLNRLDQVHQTFSEEEISCPILTFDYEQCPVILEIRIEGIGTYQLAAVRHSFGHVIPILRSESGEFFKLDDVAERAEKITKDDLSDILIHSDRKASVYYVKKS
jgi:hypothetical protein